MMHNYNLLLQKTSSGKPRGGGGWWQ